MKELTSSLRRVLQYGLAQWKCSHHVVSVAFTIAPAFPLAPCSCQGTASSGGRPETVISCLFFCFFHLENVNILGICGWWCHLPSQVNQTRANKPLVGMGQILWMRRRDGGVVTMAGMDERAIALQWMVPSSTSCPFLNFPYAYF